MGVQTQGQGEERPLGQQGKQSFNTPLGDFIVHFIESKILISAETAQPSIKKIMPSCSGFGSQTEANSLI